MDEKWSGTATSRCAWCGATFDESSDRRRGRVICARCGVATTDPWPDAEALEEAYSGWYRPKGGRFGKLGDAIFSWARAKRSLTIDRLAPDGPILDVGAGEGDLVDALRARGRDATGLDPYTARPDFLSIEAHEISGSWAAVVFWHSLEHLRVASGALNAASASLKPGGLLVISLPNASSLQARVFGDAWFPLDLPRHLVHLPAAALVQRLEELDLRIRRISYVRGGQVVFGWLHGLVASISERFDLYDALRVAEARHRPMSVPTRVVTILLGALLFPLASMASILEVICRRSGTLYVEAIRD